MAINPDDLKDLPGQENPAGTGMSPRQVPSPLDLQNLKKRLETLGVLPEGKAGTPDYKLNTEALRKLGPAEIKKIQTELSEAGLYAPKGHKHYADGRAGPSTEFALNLAIDPEFAKNFLGDEGLKKDSYMQGKDKTMQVQSALTSLGYRIGTIDGTVGRKTADGIHQFLYDHPFYKRDLSDSAQGLLEKHGPDITLKTVFQEKAAPQTAAPATAPANKQAPHARADGKNLYNPEMLAELSYRPEKRQYMDMAADAAKKYGLNEVLFVNQIYAESTFNPKLSGPMTKLGTAKGIAQITDNTARELGLSRADVFNPAVALDAAAKHMADLTRKLGSQEIATVAYNGGEGVVEYVQRRVGKNKDDIKTVTIEDFRKVMKEDQQKYGKGGFSSWRWQTDGYDAKINSARWSPQKIEQAMKFKENQDIINGSPQPQAPQQKQEQQHKDIPGAENIAQSAPAAAPALAATDNGFLQKSFDTAQAAVGQALDYTQERAQMFSSWLRQDFLGATIADTPGDIKVATAELDPHKKGPAVSSQAQNLTMV